MDLNTKIAQYRLLQLTPIEVKEEFDEKCERCYGFVQNLIIGASESEAHDTLNATVCKSPQAHEEVCLGLLISILIEPDNAPGYFRDLTYVNRDGLTLVIRDLNILILERYSKLSDVAHHQLIWLLREMLKANVNAGDSLIYNLMRQVAGGDISPKNVWLAESMLDLLNENRVWLERHNILIATSVYTYLRLIVDHFGPLHNTLRQKEVDFCISMLRERFAECIMIGRDLVRLLQNVARIPEFEALWRDIHNNPTSLAPNFNGILTLMQMRTSRRFLQCRLTPEMERKISYLTSHVKFGQQKRFQDWFQRQYLSTPESHSLRCDLIRFICGVIHPTNEVLCSEIIPRWAVIGWILSSCTSNVAASNAKLSLFYDWLFFDSERDNIMNIEPAILVMYYSLRTHPVITTTLLDFLCRITRHFSQPLAHLVKKGVYSALNFILEKRVLPSLAALFESPKIDRELRLFIRECFPEFCSPVMDVPLQQVNQMPIPLNEILNGVNGNGTRSDLLSEATSHHAVTNGNEPDADEMRFSDDECEVLSDRPLAKHSSKSIPFVAGKRLMTAKNFIPPQLDLNTLLAQFSGELRNSILTLRNEKDVETRCETMVKFLQALLQDDDLEQEQLVALSQCLAWVLRDELCKTAFCKENAQDEEALEETIGHPLYVIFRDLVQTPEEDPSKEPILTLVSGLYAHAPCVGYLLLYFLKVSKIGDSKWTAYREFTKALQLDLASGLLTDLTRCQEEEPDMLCFMIADVYASLPNVCVNNASILNLSVSSVDSVQLQQLICAVMQGNLRMFSRDSLLSLLNESLEWETFEQFCLWQLIAAHGVPTEDLLPLLPKLEPQLHSEALLHLLLLMKREEPSAELLKHLTGRELRTDDHFSVSVLKCWSQDNGEQLADLVSAQLTKGTPAKKRRQGAGKVAPLNLAIEQLLLHLDQLRQHSNDLSFFNQDSIQNSLSYIQSSCNDSQKARFGDLFALSEDLEQTTKPTNTIKSAATKASKSRTKKQLDDCPSDTEQEMPKAKKKKF